MKTILPLLIILLAGYNGCRTSKSVTTLPSPVVQQAPPGPSGSEINFSDPSTWILGYFDPGRLRQTPYSSWYMTGYDDYVFNPGVIDKLKNIEMSGISITIVLGTWCPDSRREVPRFMRILSASDFPADKVKLIGVDREKNSPVENFGSLNIERVPTFIIYKNNIEAGRIIETPSTSLEQDMVNILIRKE